MHECERARLCRECLLSLCVRWRTSVALVFTCWPPLFIFLTHWFSGLTVSGSPQDRLTAAAWSWCCCCWCPLRVLVSRRLQARVQSVPVGQASVASCLSVHTCTPVTEGLFTSKTLPYCLLYQAYLRREI